MWSDLSHHFGVIDYFAYDGVRESKNEIVFAYGCISSFISTIPENLFGTLSMECNGCTGGCSVDCKRLYIV